MKKILSVKCYIYLNNMAFMMMNNINKIGENSLYITNKIASIGKGIKLSISSLAIKLRNSINEFIHPNRYDNKVIFNKDISISYVKNISIMNEEKANIENKKDTLKERLQVLNNVELPNGDLISIDKAINSLHLYQQDNILKSKLSLIDYITNMNFKPPINNIMKLSDEFDANLTLSNPENKHEYEYEYSYVYKPKYNPVKSGYGKFDPEDYIKFAGYDKANSGYGKFDPEDYIKFAGYDKANSGYDKSAPEDYIKFAGYDKVDSGYDKAEPKYDKAEPKYDKAEPKYDKAEPKYDKAETKHDELDPEDYIKFAGYDQTDADDHLAMNKLKDIDKNKNDKVNPNINQSEVSPEIEYFKSNLLEITKDISLLDRLSDENNSYGYVFLAKVANYLDDYNKQEKKDYFNKDIYLEKLSTSNTFFNLNKKINNIVYLQYLKKEQNAMLAVENQNEDKLNSINNDDSLDEYFSEIDKQLNISNKYKDLSIEELLKIVGK